MAFAPRTIEIARTSVAEGGLPFGTVIVKDGEILAEGRNLVPQTHDPTDHAEIRSDFYDVLNSVVLVINEYNKTLIEITGHTDSTGSDAHNQQLSEARAHSVAAYFQSHDVVPERLITEGFGEKYPIASNETAEGRQQNRRVELRLVPLRA